MQESLQRRDTHTFQIDSHTQTLPVIQASGVNLFGGWRTDFWHTFDSDRALLHLAAFQSDTAHVRPLGFIPLAQEYLQYLFNIPPV